MKIFLVEMVAYDSSIPGTKTLRYTSGRRFITGPSEVPANTIYDPRVIQPALMRRDMFGAGTTTGRSDTGVGELILANGDGGLDDLLDYGLDGRSITIRYGDEDAAYPGGFITLLVATMEQVEVGVETVRVKIRDKQSDLDVPIQSTKYAGNNVLPDGLEGTDDLQGKPKPLLFGKVRNIRPPLVNTSRLIYQINDGAIESVEDVYDRGVSLGTSVIAWIAQTTGVTDDLWDVAYGAGIFVAVGTNGRLMTSSDGGITWISRTSSFGTTLITAVEWNPDLDVFCAVGAAGKIATSPDGITWTQQASPFGATVTINDIAYGNGWGAGYFVAVASDGTIEASDTGGASWQTSTTPFGGTSIECIGFGNDRFVAAGAGGKLATSHYGLNNWVLRTSEFGTDTITVSFFGRGIHVIAGHAGKVAVSSDGSTWTLRTTNVIWNLYGGGFSEELGVFVIAGQTGLFTSYDGSLWTLRTATFNPDAALGVATGGNTIVVTAESGKVNTPTKAGLYATEAELLDDALAPIPGTYKAYLAGGMIRLGSSPAGEVTVDATQGATTNDRTAGKIFEAVLTKIGKVTGDWSASDVTALVVANGSVLGYWTGLNEARAGDVLDAVLGSVEAWWGVDRLGVFRTARLEDPSLGTSVLTIVKKEMIRPLQRIAVQDRGRGIPIWRQVVRYARNWTTQTNLAGSVKDTRRADLSSEWKEAAASEPSVKDKHLMAREQIDDAFFDTEVNADAEAHRRLTLRKFRKDRFEFSIPLDDETIDLDLGNIVTVQHDRYDLSAGKKFAIISLEPDAKEEELILGVWG